jgi:hypothetical protein
LGSEYIDDEWHVKSKWERNHQIGNPIQFYETARELVEFGQSDPLALSVYGNTPLHEFLGPVETLRFLVAQQQVFDVDLEYSQLGLKLAQYLASYLVSNITDSVRFLLGDGPIPSSSIQQRFRGTSWFEGTLLTHSARRLAALFQRPDDIAKELAFMSDLIQGGADVHELHEPGATCLDFILMTWPWRTERNKQELLLEWLKCLHMAGIDLQDYCRKEEKLHQNGKIVETKTYRPGVERCFSVAYGRGRDDVMIRVHDNSIANIYKESIVPGAWDMESQFVKDNKLVFFKGTGGLADWTVVTSGFSIGDYSISEACVTAV